MSREGSGWSMLDDAPTAASGDQASSPADQASSSSEVDPLADPHDIVFKAPDLPDDQVQYWQEQESGSSSLLVIFSVLMFAVPIATVYFVYTHLIAAGWPTPQASEAAGICGILVTIALAATFAYVAYKEEARAAKIFNQEKPKAD